MVLWGNILGLYSLGILVPFIILYLIRPKPKDVTIPSLMFFLTQRGTKQRASFLRNFIQDLLFLIQLFILLALCFSLAEPIIDVPSSYRAEETVIVLDMSASMSTNDRFDKAKDIAKKNLGKRTTLVLAKDIPVTILEAGDATAARGIVNSLDHSESNSNIGDAMKTAGDKIAEGRVVVISDFMFNKGLDPLVAKSLLEAKGLVVDLFPVTGGDSNFGITDIKLFREAATIFFKNYNDKPADIRVQIGDLKKDIHIEEMAIETVMIQPPQGITQVDILTKDDMPADNTAYINIPKKKATKILLVTNEEKNFLKAALDAIPGLEIEVSNPPIIPSINHDIVIFSQVNVEKILPGTFQEIETYIKEHGGAVIFTGQEQLPQTPVMPFQPQTLSKKGAKTSIDILNQLTKGIEFGHVTMYQKGTTVNGSLTLLSTEFFDPLLVIHERGQGYAIYYGIFDHISDFKLSPSYPIFWDNLINFLTGEEDLLNFNKEVGEIITMEEVTRIETPSGALESKAVLIDEIGVYKINDRVLVGNLFNEQEGIVKADEKQTSVTKVAAKSETTTKRKENLVRYLLYIALSLIVLEIVYVKYRGDY